MANSSFWGPQTKSTLEISTRGLRIASEGGEREREREKKKKRKLRGRRCAHTRDK